MRIRDIVSWCVLSSCVWAVAPRGLSAQAAAEVDGQATALALARDAPQMLRETIAEMYETSATFRRQCVRLAAATPVTIRLHLDPRLPTASVRARASFERRDGRIVGADLVVPPSGDVAELIAHEIEHVLEQLDGIDLMRHADTGAAWRDATGAFETARAHAVGRRVARETRAGASLVLVRR